MFKACKKCGKHNIDKREIFLLCLSCQEKEELRLNALNATFKEPNIKATNMRFDRNIPSIRSSARPQSA